MSPTLIKQAVSEGFDENTSEGQAHIALVTNAAVARLARLRAVLFSLPEFRDFVATIESDTEETLIQEILQGSGAVRVINRAECEQNLRESLVDYNKIRQPDCFVEGDTPYHAAIRLGNYRFDESWHDYSAFINSVNAKGQTPLDVAIEQFNELKKQEGGLNAKGIQNPLFIIQDLIRRGARKTPAYKASQDEFNRVTIHWGDNYLSKAREAHSNELVLKLFGELGEDCQLTLRMKKELSIRCLEEHIKASEGRRVYGLEDRLKALKSALNGDARQKPDPAMQVIRQLRSRLWIVRQLRGLLGGSSTQVHLSQLLDKKLRQCFSASCRSGFFYREQIGLASKEKYDPMNVVRLDGELDCKTLESPFF